MDVRGFHKVSGDLQSHWTAGASAHCLLPGFVEAGRIARFGLRRQGEAATALSSACQSGVALRLPPQSKGPRAPVQGKAMRMGKFVWLLNLSRTWGMPSLRTEASAINTFPFC